MHVKAWSQEETSESCSALRSFGMVLEEAKDGERFFGAGSAWPLIECVRM